MGTAVVHRCRCDHRYVELVGGHSSLVNLYHDAYSGFKRDPVLEQAFRRELSANIVPKLFRGARILDVGCGNGMFLQCAADAGLAPEGIDISEAAADQCRGLGLNVRCGEITDLVPQRPEFDCITMWDALEHVPNPAAIIERLALALNPGGLLVLKVPWVHDCLLQSSVVSPRLSRVLTAIPSHVQFFTRRSLTELLRSVGFDDIDCRMSGPLRSKPQVLTLALRRIPGRLITRAATATGLTNNFMVIARRTAPGRS